MDKSSSAWTAVEFKPIYINLLNTKITRDHRPISLPTMLVSVNIYSTFPFSCQWFLFSRRPRTSNHYAFLLEQQTNTIKISDDDIRSLNALEALTYKIISIRMLQLSKTSIMSPLKLIFLWETTSFEKEQHCTRHKKVKIKVKTTVQTSSSHIWQNTQLLLHFQLFIVYEQKQCEGCVKFK